MNNILWVPKRKQVQNYFGVLYFSGSMDYFYFENQNFFVWFEFPTITLTMLPLRISSVLRVSSRLKTFKVPSLHPALQFHSTLIQNERSHLSLEQEAEFERRITEHEKKREERSQQKKKNLLIVTVITTFFAAHAICLWRRRGEFLKANEITPPIDFEAFKKNYLIPGKVSQILSVFVFRY